MADRMIRVTQEKPPPPLAEVFTWAAQYSDRIWELVLTIATEHPDHAAEIQMALVDCAASVGRQEVRQCGMSPEQIVEGLITVLWNSLQDESLSKHVRMLSDPKSDASKAARQVDERCSGQIGRA